MRIGINLLYLLPGIVGGTETYAAGLINGLAQVDRQNEYFVFVNRESAEWPLPDVPNFERVVCPVSAVSRVKRYLFQQLRLPALLREYAIDIVHSLGYVSPLLTRCPSVVTIYDLNYRAFGSQMSIIWRLALEFFVGQSATRAGCVITMSDFARSQISRAFDLPAERVHVVHGSPRSRSNLPTSRGTINATCDRLRIREPYLIAFSSTTPNKNISRLLQAFDEASNRYHVPHQLVLVGHPPSSKVLSNSIPAFTGGNVRFTGYLDEGSLRTVLSGAQMLVFPSFYEGFGLPILEAMAVGVPVVCSDQASLPEVAGDAAVFFNPFSVEDMAQKIAKVALDSGLREELRRRGFENIKRFSWEKAAYQTLQVYRNLMLKLGPQETQ